MRHVNTAVKKYALFFADKQFLLFLLFGGTAAVVSFASGCILYAWADVPYSLAVFIGSAAAIFVNFFLNYAFNFHYHGRSMAAQFVTFAAVAVFGVFLTAFVAKTSLTVSLWALPEGLFDMLTLEVACHIFSIGVVTFYSFFAHKYMSFNKGILAWVKDAAMRLKPSLK
ncbi:MAG: GtrA family protein [Desulfovibrio sp.]|nr:GtrA family protein [Desulfovibrio sp.]